jgi:hypothetical protein
MYSVKIEAVAVLRHNLGLNVCPLVFAVKGEGVPGARPTVSCFAGVGGSTVSSCFLLGGRGGVKLIVTNERQHNNGDKLNSQQLI